MGWEIIQSKERVLRVSGHWFFFILVLVSFPDGPSSPQWNKVLVEIKGVLLIFINVFSLQIPSW
jgi:hypothetical protein